MGTQELDQVRRIALALPAVSERPSAGAPCFYVQDRRALCRFHDHHRGDDRISLWCPAPRGAAEELASAEPDRFFEPPASGSGTFSNWIGVFLDTEGDDGVDWNEIAAMLEEAFRIVAPRRLLAELDDL